MLVVGERCQVDVQLRDLTFVRVVVDLALRTDHVELDARVMDRVE